MQRCVGDAEAVMEGRRQRVELILRLVERWLTSNDHVCGDARPFLAERSDVHVVYSFDPWLLIEHLGDGSDADTGRHPIEELLGCRCNETGSHSQDNDAQDQ